MELTKIQDVSSIKGSEVFRTFSYRFSRLMWLKCVCDPDHPVLQTELELMEMARSGLQEAIFSSVPRDRLKIFCLTLVASVKAQAMEKTYSGQEEDVLKEKMILLIQETTFELHPTIN
jgi:hypothetical protein